MRNDPAEVSQGRLVMIEGRPVPMGGSDVEAPSTGQGEQPVEAPVDDPPEGAAAQEPIADGEVSVNEAVQPSDGSGVQPEDSGQQSADDGQGLIEPYLDGVDPRIRDTVADRLERFRRDQDSQVNKKIERVSTELNRFKEAAESPEQVQAVMTLYNHLLQDPVNTVQWFADRYAEETGYDVRSELAMAFGQDGSPQAGQPQGEQPAPQPQGEQQEPQESSPQYLTREELEAELERREQQRQQEMQRQQALRKADQQITQAAKSEGLNLPEGAPERQVILQHAHQLYQQGQASNGAEAVRLATKAAKQRLSTALGNGQASQQQPKTAQGGRGQPSGQVEFDPSDTKQKKQAMEQFLAAQDRG